MGAIAKDCTQTVWDHSQIVCRTPSGYGSGVSITVKTQGTTHTTVLAQTWTYDLPAITSVSPSFGGTASGNTIVVQGTSLGSAAGAVTVGSFACSPSVWTDSQVTCSLAAGQGAGLTLTLTTINTGHLASKANAFSFTAPSITTISPTSTDTGITGTRTLAITGGWCQAPPRPPLLEHALFGFFSGCPSQSLVLHSAVVLCRCMSCVALRCVALRCVALRCVASCVRTCTGTNFGTSGAASVTVGSSSCSAVSGSQTSLTCTIPVGVGTGLSVVVTVASQSSNSASFSYNAPSISLISPANGPTSGSTTIVLTGTSLGHSSASTSITVGGVSCSVIGSPVHTSASCSVEAGVGTAQPVVVTVGGQISTSSVVFNYDAPVILGVSPAAGPTAGNNSVIVVNGTNFGASALTGNVRVGTVTATVQSWFHTNVSFLLPVGQGSTSIVVSVSSQSSNQFSFTYSGPSISSVVPQNGNTTGERASCSLCPFVCVEGVFC